MDIFAEARRRSWAEFLEIGKRIESLRPELPQAGSVKLVRPRLGDHVHNRSSCSAELGAEIARLHRHLLHRVGDIEPLGYAREFHVVIVSAVQQVTVPAWTLAVDCELRGLAAVAGDRTS